MTYSHLLSVLESSGHSPERLAKALGVSNMTIRRWRELPRSKKLSKNHECLVSHGLYQLIVDGHLQLNSPDVDALLRSAQDLPIAALMKNMGISTSHLNANLAPQDSVTEVLGRLGLSTQNRNKVDHDLRAIERFKDFGRDWPRLIQSLLNIVRSTRLTPLQKLVAYGALFYLICPIDLIPDHIPVFGYADDFAVLSMAVSYYGRTKTSTKSGRGAAKNARTVRKLQNSTKTSTR